MSISKRSAGSMPDVLTPAAPIDGLSCAARQAKQASRAVSFSLQAQCNRPVKAVRVPDMTANQRKKGSTVPIAVDPLGHLRAVKVTAPMRKTVLRSVHWRKTCHMAREKRSHWPMSIMEIQARKRHKGRRTTGCICSSSGGKTRQEALSCRAVGWLSQRRLGQPLATIGKG